MDLKNLCLKYFNAFSNKDLERIEEMIVAGVQLRDWDIKAYGSIDLIAANKRIFDSVESIIVIPVAMYQEGSTVIAELEIIVDGKEHINVVDIITFNEQQKIIKITAYKG